MKKLLLLGGLRYLIPVIQSAHQLGYYVITCDNIPENIAHKYSDEYHNISILNKERVLELAQDLAIDGIMSFAVDPGVITAAYVAENLSLPFAGSYEAVNILQNKDLFREFLQKHKFNVPISGGYDSYAEVLSDISKFCFPIIVKPVDSAGSKGVTRVDNLADLEKAVYWAIELSFSNRCIVEEFIEQEGHSSDSDCFSVDGKLVFCSFSDQMFDHTAINPYTPAAYLWPSKMSVKNKQELQSEIQRLFGLLKLKTSIYNIETRVGKDGKPYIMEVSPRGGGNRISEVLTKATGISLIEEAVKAAVGDFTTIPNSWDYEHTWAELILHADEEGIFESLKIDESVSQYIEEIDLWVEQGDCVRKFTGANETIGTILFRFHRCSDINKVWSEVHSGVSINLKRNK